MDGKYNHKEIEKKWQDKWDKDNAYLVDDNSNKKKFYTLVEFPYPSGAGLHVGHVRSYTALDVYSRYLRLTGLNVLYPIGWDAFGLPTENYAIKNKIHPRVAAERNIAVFTKQLKSLGLSYDWSREINTTDPHYYKWTQWIFLKLLENDLAYKHRMSINWCPSCKIGLANEEVVNGKCERCGSLSEKKEKEQWMLRITKYADRLIDDLETVDFLEKIKSQQINWIGRSEGTEVIFKINEKPVTVFTTRPDTLFGATYFVLSPEHELVNVITTSEQKNEVEIYVQQAKGKSDLERTELQKEKTGVFTGAYAKNPVNGKDMPVWIADYVLMGYGTGAIMAVPAHDERDFEFAKKYDLDIEYVVCPSAGSIPIENGKFRTFEPKFIEKKSNHDILTKWMELSDKPYIGMGYSINSDFLDCLHVTDSKKKIIKWLEKNKLGKEAINYKLRDWVFSRQHYWGEPIPVVNCSKCGIVPLSEKDLPLELPDVKSYEPTDTGESPLASIHDWVNTTCPKCGGDAKRETDTMPNWAGSSWYFLRYLDPHNDKELASKSKLKSWMPVSLYNGGMEHTTLHLLYSRFWNKFLFDIGVSPVSEPYQKRISHGMVLASDGKKMSKSLGNVINPDDVIEEYGADTLRIYEMFMGPFAETIPWSSQGLVGVRKFLDKIVRIFNDKEKLDCDCDGKTCREKVSKETVSLLHQTIKKVGDDINNFKFNTAVSQMMIFINVFSNLKAIPKSTLNTFLIILSPFAPHLSEELWEEMGNKGSILKESWPKYSDKLIKTDNVDMVIQVNGKVRDIVNVDVDANEKEVKKVYLESNKIKKWIEGKEIIKVIFVKNRLINIVVK